MQDPDWLLWAREIQAIAQTGLAFSKDPYDLDRFAALRRLAARIMADTPMPQPPAPGRESADQTRINPVAALTNESGQFEPDQVRYK